VNVLLVAASVVVSVLLGEFAVRTAAPQITLYPRYVESDDYPIMTPPNARMVHSQGRLWRLVYTTNSSGHRGPDVPIADPTSRVRVVVLGDSFSFGMGVNDNEEYPRRLAEKLGPSFEVINGGMPGWGLDSEIKWYLTAGAAYRPAVVILQFSQNDPSDPGSNPVARVEGGRLVVYRNGLRKAQWHAILSESSLLQESHAYALLRVILSSRSRKASAGSTNAAGRSIEDTYLDLLTRFADSLQDSGVKLLFMSVTHEHDGSYHYESNDFPTILGGLERLNRDGAIRFVKLPLEEMRRYPKSPEPSHQWSAAHHNLVADSLAIAVKSATVGASTP